ncbi:MAG: peptidoglycan recognition family protein [Planctomycetota bacterium]|nr:peptidoglycan recognition family protein [Planctomycetota bacterium]
MDHRNSFKDIRLHRIEAFGGLIALLLTGCLQTQTVNPVNSTVSGTSNSLKSQQRSSSEKQLVQTLRPSGKERDWKHIVLHHTATDQGSVASIHASHQERKGPGGKRWLGIGYHFVIGNGNGMGDGEVQPTFRWEQQLQGAHAGSSNREYNQLGIGVALIGNFENRSPTSLQIQALKRLVNQLQSIYGIGDSQVIEHRHIRKTACPGRHFSVRQIMASNRFDSRSFPVTLR